MHQLRRVLHRLQHPLLPGFGRQKLPGRDLPGPVEIVFLLVPAAVFEWGAGAVFFEQPVEIGHVVEPGAVADLVDGFVGAQQQLAGVADAHVQQELGETLHRVFLKEMAEGRAGHVDQRRHVADLDAVVSEVFQDVTVHQLNAVVVRAEGLRGKARAGQESAFRRLGQQVEQLQKLDNAGKTPVLGQADHLLHGCLEGLALEFDAPRRIAQQLPDFVKTLLLKKMPGKQVHRELDGDDPVGLPAPLQRLVRIPLMV